MPGVAISTPGIYGMSGTRSLLGDAAIRLEYPFGIPLEGALRPIERARFEGHVAQCERCPTYLDQMRTAIRLMGKLTTESLSPAARHDLLARFRDWKQQQASLEVQSTDTKRNDVPLDSLITGCPD
jgi:hypothetical protein